MMTKGYLTKSWMMMSGVQKLSIISDLTCSKMYLHVFLLLSMFGEAMFLIKHREIANGCLEYISSVVEVSSGS